MMFVLLGFVILLVFMGVIVLYKYQEKFIFLPDKLDSAFKFEFDAKFEEKFIKTSDNEVLHGLLFKCENSRGVVFYLHGNQGAMNSWGFLYNVYLERQYDLFILDYRGYGKSSGRITNENQLLSDSEAAYRYLAGIYPEDKIVVIGHSLGTCPAAYIASKHKPGLLILLSPYYSFKKLVNFKYPAIPDFLIRYNLPTYQYIKDVNCPVAIFHGRQDNLIPPGMALSLKDLAKLTDKAFILDNLGHNGMNQNADFLQQLDSLLTEHQQLIQPYQ
ncbi:MAG: alpha/beta fold hydrolase [Bacteroidales bacterium]